MAEFHPPFDISHLSEEEQNRIKRGELFPSEMSKIRNNKTPWPKPVVEEIYSDDPNDVSLITGQRRKISVLRIPKSALPKKKPKPKQDDLPLSTGTKVAGGTADDRGGEADAALLRFMDRQGVRAIYEAADAEQKEVLWKANKGAFEAAEKRKEERLLREQERTEKILDMLQRIKEDPGNAHLLPPADSSMDDLRKWFEDMSRPVRNIPFPGEGGRANPSAVPVAEDTPKSQQRPKPGIKKLQDETERAIKVMGEATELLQRKIPKPPTANEPSQEPKVKNSFGWLALAFALVERGLDVIGFQNVVAGALLFVGAFVAFVFWFIGWERARRWQFSKRALIVVLGALLYFPLVGYQLYAQYKGQHQGKSNPIATGTPLPESLLVAAPVYPLFREAYDDYSKELGPALKKAEPLDDPVYYAEHEHAKVIWIQKRNAFYLLGFDNTWKSKPDQWGAPFKEWLSDKHNRTVFGTPRQKYPPYGGVAMGWNNDPDEWRWVGWRLWHCSYSQTTPDKTIHIQPFEHGVITGGYARTTDEDNAQVIFIIMDAGHRWESRTLQTKGSPCGVISTE